jgi:hypothetical protein
MESLSLLIAGALFVLVSGVLNVSCFVIGAKVGQNVSKGEKIETPSLNPIKAIREREDRKEAEREQERYDAILRNIESYDGTGRGQEDVPRG